jgi:uncharacterized membrane-anchored protein
MIRVAIYLYLLIVGVAAAIAFWLADRHGDLVIAWQGTRIDTSAWMLLVAVAVIAVPMVLLWSIMHAIGKSLR